MEESAQILEIETFIPLLLQTPQDGFNRLKRWIMIGDHHQLPPVIKNMAFQKFSNMEQSLFTRFVRLGVPTVQLDAQGRARPSLCSLYQWRYRHLGNLQHVGETPEYRRANAGFVHDFQLVNVEDFQVRFRPSSFRCTARLKLFFFLLRRAKANRSRIRTFSKTWPRPSTWWPCSPTCVFWATRPRASPS